jgi:hypothetical protein
VKQAFSEPRLQSRIMSTRLIHVNWVAGGNVTEMQDDDWMVPRRLHFSGTAGPEQISEGNDLSIDTEFLRKRELRKLALQPQPTTPIAENNPWADLDRSIARALPAFPDRMWTLGDTARWVIERTPEAVDGHSIDEDKLFEILPDIHGALSDGEVSAFAITQNDPVPRELPAATWSIYQLVVEEKNGLIRIFPLISSSTEHEQHLLNVKVKREDVLQRWPSSSPPSVPQTTMGAENQCRQWLATMMKEASAQPIPKATLRKEALTKFRGLAKRGFDRAWDRAIREANALHWRASGRRT